MWQREPVVWRSEGSEEKRAGCGFGLVFLMIFLTAVTGLVMMVRAGEDTQRVHGMALFMGGIGAGFVFGAVYVAIRGMDVQSTTETGISFLNRHQRPVAYWGAILLMVLLGCAGVGLAMWMWWHPGEAAVFVKPAKGGDVETMGNPCPGGARPCYARTSRVGEADGIRLGAMHEG